MGRNVGVEGRGDPSDPTESLEGGRRGNPEEGPARVLAMGLKEEGTRVALDDLVGEGLEFRQSSGFLPGNGESSCVCISTQPGLELRSASPELLSNDFRGAAARLLVCSVDEPDVLVEMAGRIGAVRPAPLPRRSLGMPGINLC